MKKRRGLYMYVWIRDCFGNCDKFKVIETGKAPEGYGYKVSVTFLNSGDKVEKAVVNPDHIQCERKSK